MAARPPMFGLSTFSTTSYKQEKQQTMTTTIEATTETTLEMAYAGTPLPKKSKKAKSAPMPQLPTGPFPSANCVTEVLLSALKLVGVAVAGRSTLPVISYVRFTGTAETHRLRLQATNLEIGLETTITAKIDQDFDVCLPWAELKDWKPKQFGQFMTLTTDKPSWTNKADGIVTYERCIVTSNNLRDVYATLEADEFPVLPEFASPTEITLTPEIVEMLLRTRYAAADDDTRPVLAGVWIDIKAPVVQITAADGFRLHTERAVIDDDNAACAINIPATALDQFAKLNVTGPVVLQLNGAGQAALAWHDGRTKLTTRLIDGRWPDVERIIPKQFDSRTIVNRRKLLELCRTLEKKAAAGLNILRLYIETPNGKPTQIRLVVTFNELASERMLPLDTAPVFRVLEPGEVTADHGNYIAINIGLFIDALEHLTTDEIAIELQSPQMPMLLRPVGGGTARLVVMPMTVK